VCSGEQAIVKLSKSVPYVKQPSKLLWNGDDVSTLLWNELKSVPRKVKFARCGYSWLICLKTWSSVTVKCVSTKTKLKLSLREEVSQYRSTGSGKSGSHRPSGNTKQRAENLYPGRRAVVPASLMDIRGFPRISVRMSVLARLKRQGYPWFHRQRYEHGHKLEMSFANVLLAQNSASKSMNLRQIPSKKYYEWF